MPPSEPNPPQPTPEPECPRIDAQFDGPPSSSRFTERPDSTSTGRRRAAERREPEADRAWGLSSEWAVDFLPGEPPVRVSRTLAQAPADPPTGEAEIFTGLTPRVAALLVISYTRPGDIVLDATADLAVEGTATAGSRQYHRRAPDPDLTSEPVHGGSRASLVVLAWPTELSSTRVGDATRQAREEAALESTLVAGRKWGTPDAHLVVVAGPSSQGSYRDRALALMRSVRTTGGGRLRQIILVEHGPSDDAENVAPGGLPNVTDVRPSSVVFVVALRVGNCHD
jgi:hypothetical protein